MIFTPSKTTGLAVAGAAAAILAGLCAGAMAYLRAAPFSFFAFLALIVLAASLPALAFIGYRSYGLARGRYVLSRNALVVEWGWRRELIPLAAIRDVRAVTGPDDLATLRPHGLAWPGCLVGRASLPEAESVEFLAGSGARGLVRVDYGPQSLVLSPPDPEAFVQTFAGLQSQGPSAVIEPESVFPSFQRWDFWQDRLALGLIAIGGISAVVLWGYLLLTDVDLVLLPIIAGLAWVANTLLGLELRRRATERPMAYLLFGATLFAQALLWAAAVSGASARR